MRIEYPTYHTLNNDDQTLIRAMSAEIVRQGREYFVDNYQRDKSLTLEQLNLNGFGAELAFCRMVDVPFDSSTEERENHFTKKDAVLPDGRSVDVKTTVYSSGSLIVRTGKEKSHVDIFALMIGEFPYFYFVGWSTYDELIKPENLSNFGHGMNYAFPQWKLCRVLTDE